MTATPEQLQLMLYDGMIRFSEQAKMALTDKKFDSSFDLLTKAQRIVMELQCGLKHDVSPDLCGKLSALYNYIHRKLIDANTQHVLGPLDEALQIMRYQRDTWAMLLSQLSQSKAGMAAMRLDMPGPDARKEASISLQG